MLDAPANQYLIIEGAGLFWIGAEIAILFAMCEARCFFNQHALPSHFIFGATQMKRALIWTLPLIVLCLWVIYCHNFGGDLRWQWHILTWCAFVFIWVLLECLIVWQGCMIFVHLCDRLGVKNMLLSVCVAFVFFALTLSSPLMLALMQHVNTHGNDTQQLAENGMYFLLRLAGVFWISVEWIAALVLLRAYFIFKRRVAA